MELEKKYNEPHSFTSFKVGTTQYECSYCHHAIRDKEGKAVPFERGGKRVRDYTAFYCISFYLSLSLSLPLSLQHSSARIVPVHVTTIANVICPQTVGPSVSLGAGDNN